MEKIIGIKSLVSAAFVVSSFVLISCGSSDDGSSAISPNGIYSGSITGGIAAFNGDERAIVYNNRLMIMSMPGTIQQQFDGMMVVNEKTLSVSDFPVYQASVKTVAATLTLNGSFVSNSSLTGAFSDTATTPAFPDGNINLSADSSIFSEGSELSRVAFDWTGPYVAIGDMRISIASNGDLTGEDDEGCVYAGSISVPDASLNVYDISMVSTASCTTLPDSTYTGYAWTEDGNSKLFIMVANGINARAVIMTKI